MAASKHTSAVAPVALPLTYVREILNYDPETGRLSWRNRPVDHFKTAAQQITWNRLYAGKGAGYIDTKGYRRVAIFKIPRHAHRVCWLLYYGTCPDIIDHIDGDPLNNRISNLRAATHSQNMMNRRIHSTNASGYKGVKWDEKEKRWEARIRANGVVFKLGRFKTAEAASAAYQNASIKHHGEFARAK